MPKGKTNKRYTPEFKVMVVETLRKDRLSYCEAARQFEVSDNKRIASWECIYLTEGPEGNAVGGSVPPAVHKKVVHPNLTSR